MVNILSGRIKKKDIAEYFQKLAMLLDTGYDLCSADELLTVKDAGRRRDSSADGVRRIANLLLPDLREGFSLNKALASHPKNFAEYVQQVEVGELSGRTGEVLTRISEQIKNSGKIMAKLKGA